jgi:hypothetical protein
MHNWLIDERKTPSAVHLEEIDRELADIGASRGGSEVPALAVLLHDVVIHDNKKWFGEADVRLDTLVITGCGQAGDSSSSFYMPKTTSFVRVGDEDRLPIGGGGLLVYYGQALHFLDILIMVSRNRQDSQDLAGLLAGKLGSDEMKGAVGALLGLAVAAPTVAAVTTAMGAAAVLGDLVYRVLGAVTGATIGLYRNSHLQFRDGFGVGAHPGPDQQCFRVKDLSFRYEIVREAAP